MNEYIGTVKDNYMFTNRLSGITVGDILYNYEKLGKVTEYEVFCEMAGGSYHPDYSSGMYEYKTKSMLTAQNDYNAYQIKPIYQGTGKITKKYRVVEVYDTNLGIKELDVLYNSFVNLSKITNGKYIELGFKSHKYLLKLKLIEQVDIELSEFASYRKVDKAYDERVSSYHKQGHFAPMSREQWFKYINLIDEETLNQCKLTRYNGLQKVIYIGGKR